MTCSGVSWFTEITIESNDLRGFFCAIVLTSVFEAMSMFSPLKNVVAKIGVSNANYQTISQNWIRESQLENYINWHK